MQKSTILFVAFTCMSVLAISQNKYATVNIVQAPNSYGSTMLITYETGQQERIELQPTLNAIGKSIPEGIESNQRLIVETFNKLSTKGYKVISESGSTYGAIRYNDYLLAKE